MSSSRSRFFSSLAALLFLACATPAWALEKWFYQPTNLAVDANVDKIEALWKRFDL